MDEKKSEKALGKSQSQNLVECLAESWVCRVCNNRCWVNKCELCDLCSSPPRCLKDFEAPLHLAKFQKVSHRRPSVAPENMLPLFSLWLTRSSSAVSQTEHPRKEAW
ncbi:hypothetical protein AV530_006514 [Patagioenas fasciata monilis]|uniref:Uncharacterized protein n=1 Tax=Patagioenas fasciata monilis TaxID=372326 RepID=A0A1V4KGT7_PATFA|nr:hypothetical protein AV530_006514 [Patagioenas fasciata monilis]